MEKDILALRNKLNFDPRLFSGDDITADDFSRRIREYQVWSMGNSGVLRRFYTGGKALGGDAAGNASKLSYFWTKAPSSTRMIHSGIPGLISTRMADILFRNGVDISVTVFKDGEGESLAEDKGKSKQANALMTELVRQMNLQRNLQTAATNESWGGHCFFRLSHDVSVSPYPILETFDVTQAEVVRERGVTQAIIFHGWYEHKGKTYRLDEIYSTTENGDGCITYRLFTFDGKKERECDLLCIPQTAELFRIGARGAENGIVLDERQRFVYEGLKGMLAFEKPNKTPSLEFPQSDLGASDYEGALDNFDALDEIASGNVREVRANATKRYVPTTMIPRDEHGEPLPFDEFCESYVKTEGDVDQGAVNKIEVEQVADKTASFMEKWKAVLSTVCNKAKISPFSLGVTWLEAVNPSAESQRERNKMTLDMRAGKLALWKPFLEELLVRSLQLYAWMGSHTKVVRDGMPELSLAWENTAVTVEFGEYIEESVEQRILTWGGALAQGVVSTSEAVRSIHPDWTEKAVENEVNLIRYERGMGADDPITLPTLTGEE